MYLLKLRCMHDIEAMCNEHGRQLLLIWFMNYLPLTKFHIDKKDTVQLRWFFKPPPPPPPTTGGVDFLAHRGSSWYPTPIPSATDFSSVFPPSSFCNTTHLPVELRGWKKFILASSQWKISDVNDWQSSPNFPSLHVEEIGTFILLTHHSADLLLNKYRNIST